MDTQVLLDFRSNIRKILLGKDPTITLDTLHKDGKRELQVLWLRNLLGVLIICIPAAIYVIFYVVIIFRIAINRNENRALLISQHVNLKDAGKRFIMTAIATLVVLFAVYPSILDRKSIMFDIKRLLFGNGKLKKKEYKDLVPDAPGLKLRFPGIFTIETSSELDEVMVKMREAIGYNVIRGDDHIDVMSLIENIIIPRILAANTTEARPRRPEREDKSKDEGGSSGGGNGGSDKGSKGGDEVAKVCKESVAALPETVQNSANNTDAETCVNEQWNVCQPEMYDLCHGLTPGSDNYNKYQCKKMNSVSNFVDGFRWKARDVFPDFKSGKEEDCFKKCDGEYKDICQGALFEDGACYIFQESDTEWVFDAESSGGSLYKKNLVMPDNTIGSIVTDIIETIQLTSPLIDLTEYRTDILKRLSTLDNDYLRRSRFYEEVVDKLIYDSVNIGSETEEMSKGANLRADLLITNEYLNNTTVAAFKKHIAWPVVRSSIAVSARHHMFELIAKRQKELYTFKYALWTAFLSFFVCMFLAGLAFIIYKNKSEVPKHLFPLIPILMFIAITLVTVFALMYRDFQWRQTMVFKQAENSAELGERLCELAKLFGGGKEVCKRTFEDAITIDAGLADAYLTGDMSSISFLNGDSSELMAKALPRTLREKIVRYMAMTLESYDKCNNIIDSTDVPFPTIPVTAYAMLVAVGIVVLMSLPNLGPKKITDEIRFVNSLYVKIQGALELGDGQQYRSLYTTLCEFWKDTVTSTKKQRSSIAQASVFISVIFGVVYIVQTTEEAVGYKKSISVGTRGLVGPCL